jgi:hypothetical protein
MAAMPRVYPVVSTALLLVAATASAPAQTRDPLPVPDVGVYKTLKCDLHMHTVFSDGEVWPTTRVTEAWRDGLDAIAITDHHIYRPHKADLKEDIARPYEIAQPLARQLGLILIPGVEFSEGLTHANALFVSDANAFKGLGKIADGFAEAKKQNAFTFWNHPGWQRRPEWFPDIAAAYNAHQFQGMEIVNGRDFYPEAYPWIDEKKLTILADSDVHTPIDVAYGRRERPVTLVFAKQADAAGIREALEARRTAAWMGGEVWGSETLLRGLWQGAIEISGNRLAAGRNGLILRNRSAIPFRAKVVKTPAWLTVQTSTVQPEKMAGFVLAVSKSAPAGKTDATIELEITNLHTAPGRNLTVSVPVTLDLQL